MDNKKTFMTVEEAAELLKVTEATVRSIISKSELKAYKRLGKWYIFEEDVIQYIKEGQSSSEK